MTPSQVVSEIRLAANFSWTRTDINLYALNGFNIFLIIFSCVFFAFKEFKARH